MAPVQGSGTRFLNPFKHHLYLVSVSELKDNKGDLFHLTIIDLFHLTIVSESISLGWHSKTFPSKLCFPKIRMFADKRKPPVQTAESGAFRRDLGCANSEKLRCGCANGTTSAPGCGHRCGNLRYISH